MNNLAHKNKTMQLNSECLTATIVAVVASRSWHRVVPWEETEISQEYAASIPSDNNIRSRK
jgi:hypothetical protein